VPTPWQSEKRRERPWTGPLPGSLYGFVWRVSTGDQVWLLILSGLVAVMNTVPIEIQRRVVNRSLKEGSFRSLTYFVAAYALVVLVQGGLKLLSNIYRSWVSEHCVRSLRSFLNRQETPTAGENASKDESAAKQGTEISMIIAESEPIGAFVGESVAEPLLQAGIMLFTIGYLVVLQPVISIAIAGVFVPQFVFVPLMQHAITVRAEKRIAVLRTASASVVDDNGDGKKTSDGDQEARFARVFALNMGVYKLKFSMNFLTNLCHQLGIAGILGIGGWYVVNGKTEVGTVVAFISGLGTIKDPWDDLTTWFQTMMVTRARYKLFHDALAKRASGHHEETGEPDLDVEAAVS
jgi:ABC-type bacteriocin/lantibiotic exporter with double-glycine peptidase domain